MVRVSNLQAPGNQMRRLGDLLHAPPLTFTFVASQPALVYTNRPRRERLIGLNEVKIRVQLGFFKQSASAGIGPVP